MAVLDQPMTDMTRDLAQQWGVSVFTINEAMKALSSESLIVSKPRAGRVVNEPFPLGVSECG
jgi:DNA-binding GntR family transcriptional regulator